MSFHEVSLPSRLAFGSTGGVERRTEVVTLGSGFERRSTPWAQGRRRWLIGASLRSLADMAELVAFFEARRGRLYGFRFRDFMDFRSGAPGAVPTATDQAIGTGDGTTTQFQLVKGEWTTHELLITLFLFLTAPVTANMIAKVHLLRLRHGEGSETLGPAGVPPPPPGGGDWATHEAPHDGTPGDLAGD
jgi:uncharacterized protein (TIGR02217 family)